MNYLLATVPILVVLTLMLLLRWGGQHAGPAGLLAGLLVAAAAFGLTPDILWVSQLKGLFLSLSVLAVLWPALLLYNVVSQVGGIDAVAQALERAIGDRGLLLVILAWAFAGMLEGLAGFGLPIAIVAPMLVGLGVSPVVAVAAVAVGHAWSVTFGDMGVIFQTLTAVVKMDGALLAPTAAIMLGVACLACGLAAARILGQSRHAPALVGLAILMGTTQYVLAVSGLTSLAAFGAGLAGVVGGIVVASRSASAPGAQDRQAVAPALYSALGSYGSLTLLMSTIALVLPLRSLLDQAMWQMAFPQVATLNGFVTPAGSGQAFHFLTHPGSSILLIAIASYGVFAWQRRCQRGSWRAAALATWRSAAPASVGIIAMVGLSTLMDHSGMTLLLAQALGALTGPAFPIVSPLVGMLGAFATGSNNNSNVLFGSLQQNAAVLLGLDPRILVAAQTTGGSLGSMLAPAKIIVGFSTVGVKGRDGEAMRITVPYGLVVGLALGVMAWVLSRG